MTWALIVTLIGVLVAPLVTYVVATRRMSGRIATSSADALWSESKSIREDYRDQLQTAFGRLAGAEGRVANLEGTNTELVRENYELKRKVLSLETLVGELRSTIANLQTIIAANQKGPTP